MGFDSRSEFSFTDGSMGKNAIIFGADMSSSVHIDKKNKDTLIYGKPPTQGLDDTTLTAENIYPINFTQPNSFLFVNAAKIYQFKAKKSEIKDYALCLGSISKLFRAYNMKKKTGLKGIINFFSSDFNPIDTNDVFHIHKYLMKKS